MAHLKQQFRDALSAIEPGEDTTSGPEAHRLVRNTFGTQLDRGRQLRRPQ